MLRGEKGHATILNALPSVISRFPNIRYIIAGEGSCKADLENLVAELKINRNVYFAGMIQPISNLLRISTIAILPSLMEPLGMFQIEAQYLGVPTIASCVDGIPETLINQETGLLVEPGNPEAWAEAINWALEHLPLMQEWALKGRVLVENKFSLEKNIQQLIKLIQS